MSTAQPRGIELPPYVLEAMAVLEAKGFEAFVVGGTLRDQLLGLPCHDFDLCTNAWPEQLMACFWNRTLIPTGLKHGTVSVLFDGQALEITTYRTDGPYSDHRRPDSVCFTRSLREDLARRDFTINALAYHPRTGLIDYFGGLSDLDKRQIRSVGSARRRFNEDALRLLRALRLSAQLDFSIESATASALFAQKELLRHISVERIAAELLRLLCAPAVLRALMCYWPLLCVPIPELIALENYEQNTPHHRYPLHEHTARCVALVPPEPALRLAALFHDIGKPDCRSVDADGSAHYYAHAERSTELATAILERLRFPKPLCRKVENLIRHHGLPLRSDARSLRRALARLGEEEFFALIQHKKADVLAQGTAPERVAVLDEVDEAARRLLAEKPCLSVRQLAVGGHDLMALGYEGAAIGRALRALLEEVLAGEIQNERAELLSALKKTNHLR